MIFGNVESSSICSTLIVDWLSNWTCNRMHCINSLITNFLNLIIYNLQSPICTFSNIIYKICETKDGVILVSKSAELSFSTKSVTVHMSEAVLCTKNFGQISENAVEQLQVPRNQRELTFATISLKERCTDWFTWCNSTVMMTNMKRNNILTTLSFWNYPILNKGSPPKKLNSV